MKNRVFIAFNISERAREKISSVSESLRQEIKTPSSWVNPVNMHITLAFIGKIKTKRLNRIISDMANNTQFKQFSILAKTLSCFPGIKRPRVLWIGTQKEGDASGYYKQISEIIKSSGAHFDAKPKYIPHITIARFKKQPNPNELKKIEELSLKFTPLAIDIESISVYESIPSPQGAKYIELYQITH